MVQTNDALKLQLDIAIFGVGDSEVYYFLPVGNFSNPIAAIQDITQAPSTVDALNSFIWGRLQVLSPLAAIQRVRVSRIDSTRQAAYLDLTVAGFSNSPVGVPAGWQGQFPANSVPRGGTVAVPSGAVETFSNLMCTWRSDPGGTPFAWNQHELYAVPEVIVSPSQGYAPNPDWIFQFGLFSGFALNFVQLRTRKGDTMAASNISALVVDPSAKFFYVQPIPAGLTALGQTSFVDVRGVKFPHKLTGRHRGQQITADATTPFLAPGNWLRVGPGRGTYRAFPVWSAASGGTVQVVQDQFLAAKSITPQRVSERKHGRPPDAPVGHAKAS